MRNARYQFYVVKFLNLPFEKCREYVSVPKAWIAESTKKGIFVRYPSEEIKLMKKLVRKRRKYKRDWKFYRAELIFGADKYDEVKKCIEEKNFNIRQDFWVPKKKNGKEFRLKKWFTYSSGHDPPTVMITALKPKVDKPQMKVAPTRNYQNAAIKIPTRRFSWPNITHKREVGKKLTTLSVTSADQATCSSESTQNISENRLLSVHRNQTNNEPNRTIVRMATMINDIIDKACPQMNGISSQNRAIQSGPTLEVPTNQLNILDHENCLVQKSHTQNFTSDKHTEMRANYETVYPNNNIDSNLIPTIVSNSPTSANQSHQSFGHYNANQPLPHTNYLHPYPYAYGTLASMSAVVNNIDQRRSPQRHITNSTSYPSRESEHASSFWDNELMRHNLQTHLLTRRCMEINGYQEINPQNATTNITSYSGAIQSFHKPVQAHSSQPVEDRSSLGLRDYLLLDQTSQKPVINKATGKNPIPLKTTKPPVPQNPSNLMNQYIRPSFQEHFSAIHKNFIFEDIPTQTLGLQNTETVNGNQRAYPQSSKQDYTTLTDQNYTRLYIPQPRPPVKGYSNRDSYVQDRLIRNPINFNSHGINHQKFNQGMPIPEYRPQPSTSIITKRNPMHTLPSFQDYSNAGVHHSHSNEHSNVRQIPPQITAVRTCNIQQDLRQKQYLENFTDTINVNGYTQENVMNKNVKVIPNSTNNSCYSCNCLHYCKDQAESNKKENRLYQSARSQNNIEHKSISTATEMSKSCNEERFPPVRVGYSFIHDKINVEKLQADSGVSIHNSKSYTKSRSSVIQKSSNSKNKPDSRKNAEYKIITKYLDSYVKKMYLFSSIMLKMHHEEQRTLRDQKEILEELMKCVQKCNNR